MGESREATAGAEAGAGAEKNKLKTGTMAIARYGGSTHFVKWDDWKEGGRWYECTVGEQMSNGKYHTVGHEGSEDYFSPHHLTPLGGTPSVGDEVIAYWDGRDYAFLAKVTAEQPGKWSVLYLDGSEEWMPVKDVHKLQRMG